MNWPGLILALIVLAALPRERRPFKNYHPGTEAIH
jgi:hypothetical protein